VLIILLDGGDESTEPKDTKFAQDLGRKLMENE